MHKKKTILIVDDRADIRKLAEAILADKGGYATLHASNGQEGLEQFLKHKSQIALVLTDMDMPEMTGDYLALHIHKERPDTPVIIMSGGSGNRAKRFLELYPQVRFIHKPFSPLALLEVVNKILSKE